MFINLGNYSLNLDHVTKINHRFSIDEYSRSDTEIFYDASIYFLFTMNQTETRSFELNGFERAISGIGNQSVIRTRNQNIEYNKRWRIWVPISYPYIFFGVPKDIYLEMKNKYYTRNIIHDEEELYNIINTVKNMKDNGIINITFPDNLIFWNENTKIKKYSMGGRKCLEKDYITLWRLSSSKMWDDDFIVTSKIIQKQDIWYDNGINIKWELKNPSKDILFRINGLKFIEQTYHLGDKKDNYIKWMNDWCRVLDTNHNDIVQDIRRYIVDDVKIKGATITMKVRDMDNKVYSPPPDYINGRWGFGIADSWKSGVVGYKSDGTPLIIDGIMEVI
jgi:hypothetical protein